KWKINISLTIYHIIKRGGKTGLVTGAASGLGYELATLLAKDGYDLILADVDSEKLQESKSEIAKQYPVNIELIVKDLSQKNIAEQIFQALEGRTVDVLINNAGFGIFGNFHDTEWQREED